MNTVPKPPLSARVGILLTLANAILWLVFAMIVIAGGHPSYPPGSSLNTLMASLAFLGAVAMGVLVFGLSKRNKWGYVLTLVALTALILLTIADEVGLLDLAALVLELLPLVLLFRNRRWFLGEGIDNINAL